MPLPVPAPELVQRFRGDLLALTGGAPERVGVALSGGGDSLALLLLASAGFPGRVAAATVDHGLRAGSAPEADFAGRVCARGGIAHAVLPVEVAPQASVQAAAREARYAALTAWAGSAGAAVVLTAHHADDQAETLLMRLLRGSGVAGLAGVRPCLALSPAVLLCRPLLAWRRATLASIVADAGLSPVDDPSNHDEAFDRVRMRRRLVETPWLDPVAIARSAAALAEADNALDAVADLLFDERVETGAGSATLRPDGIPEALLRRLVTRALTHVAPAARPRGEQVGALIAALRAGRTLNLGGALCRGGETWRFEPEPPRAA
jgi:tRNA(Ile)-lysidine synthase